MIMAFISQATHVIKRKSRIFFRLCTEWIRHSRYKRIPIKLIYLVTSIVEKVPNNEVCYSQKTQLFIDI